MRLIGSSDELVVFWRRELLTERNHNFEVTDLPVMDILNEFRALAGIRGRNAHRPTQPPQYDHRVKMEIDEQ